MVASSSVVGNLLTLLGLELPANWMSIGADGRKSSSVKTLISGGHTPDFLNQFTAVFIVAALINATPNSVEI